MICPNCKTKFKNPLAVAGGKAGGKAKVAKGFALSRQPSPEARARGWATRKARKEGNHDTNANR